MVTEVKIEDENPPEEDEAEHKLSDDFFRAMKEDDFYIKNENVEYITLEDNLSDYISSSHWCSVKYYEKSCNVSDEYLVHLDTPIVNIHSLVETPDPPEEWTSYFNLNDFENEHRDEETQKTRSKIGEGISLTYVDGKLFLTNNSKIKIYYQSWIGNDILNHHKSTVVEVKSKMEGIAVFDLSYFAEYLNRASDRMQSAINQQCLDLVEKGMNDLKKLIPGCIIRISLGQGYGELYHQKGIKFCPCWIELKLFTPQKWLDMVMKHYEAKQYETELGPGGLMDNGNQTLFN